MTILNILRLPLFIAILSVLCVFCPKVEAAGGSSTGGGYQYRDTSYPNIKRAQDRLINALAVTSDEELNLVTQTFNTHKISSVRLREIIKNLKFAPVSNEFRNVDGYPQPLDMNYSVKGQYIVALEPMFKALDKKIADEDVLYTMRKILHEATHLFNIGIDDDNVSYAVSKALLREFWFSGAQCGATGTIEERIQNCRNMRHDESDIAEGGNLGAIVSKYERPLGSNLIYDAQEKLGYFVLLTKLSVDINRRPMLKDSNLACSNAIKLNGQISWRAATLEQVQQLTSLDFSAATLIFENNQTRHFEKFGGIGGFFVQSRHIVNNRISYIITSPEYPGIMVSKVARLMCVGTLN